jgi:hypothetical protein
MEIGDYNGAKCYLICGLNFHGLPGNLSAVMCVYKFCGYLSASCWGRGGGGGMGLNRFLSELITV